MSTTEYIEKLLKIFDSMTIDQIAYLDYNPRGNVIRYIQDNNITKFTNLYFNFTESGFIKWSTVRDNRESLSKLLNYRDELITFSKYKYGFEFRVYNRLGEIVDRRFIRFIDKVNFITKFFLTRRHPNLALPHK